MPKVSQDLTGQWQFKEYPPSARRMRDLDSADWLQTSVPTSIFSSLIKANKISQTEINTYPENFAWVSEKPWIYRKTFDAQPELINCDRIDMVFDGLDTVATIWLNDKLVGRTNNMFISHRFDVTKLLKPQNNSLLVKFEPAISYAKSLMARYTVFDESDFSNPYRAYIRKAQYQFGWDFCPQLPGCGIWLPVQLHGIQKAEISDLHIRTVECNQNYADIKITTEIDAIKQEEIICKLTLSCNEQTTEHNLTFTPGEKIHSTVIHIKNPYLWWPAGLGKQNLYQLNVQLINNGQVIDQTQKKIGIRTTKLNRSNDKYGQKFQFEVNHQPLFAKGANWIPASIFAGSVTTDDYQKLLHAAADANINMLRVWGGGYYETDEFYDLCDQLGIMIWQDFMFACAYYPDRQWFLDEVKKEATETIKRLRNHPCLALWCGNNEIDWMHNTSRLGKNKKFHGKEIYHKLLPKLIEYLDADTSYIPTTPLATTKNHNSPNSGTIHQWNVWSGHQPITNYLCPTDQIPRFVTEFGLQSLPNNETIKSFCPPEKFKIGSQLLEKHNYQPDGNSRLYRYMGDLFGTAKNLDQFVYLSQLAQARAAKAYTEHLMAHNLRNNGILFWQFNDCCPAISWSAIDYNKKPKALYYYAKRFFKKLSIAVVPEFDKAKKLSSPVNVVVTNNSDKPVTATLSCRLIDFSGQQLDQVKFPVAITPFGNSPLFTLPKAIVLPSDPHKTCLHLLIDDEGRTIAENLFFYLPDKYIDWPEVEITQNFSKITEKQWKLELRSNAIAKDVNVNTAIPSTLSDNFVDLLPYATSEITIDFEQEILSAKPAIELFSLKSAL